MTMRSDANWLTGKRGLRATLLRGASLVALIAGAAATPVSAQSLSALRAAVGANNAQIAAMMKAQEGQGVNTAGMNAAAARALQYQSQVSQAISLAQQAQAAARQAVLGTTGNVPDGLVIGGLQEVPNPLPAAQDPTGESTWQGADQPTQTTSANKVDVTIKQTQPRAILSWETFNVGQNTTLNFDQSLNGTAQPSWIALNRVVGTSTSPTQILGTINAPGTVLVIDQNGILFGGGSQINVNGLIASSLEFGPTFNGSLGTPYSIKDRNGFFLQYGLLGVADQSVVNTPYTFSEVETCQSGGSCTFFPSGPIEVQAGANISTDAGGFILLNAPQVINQGTLTSPQGQVSLEAAQAVTLQRSTGAAGTPTPDIRGFSLLGSDLSQISNNYSGSYVENSANGIISAPQGYVSLQTDQYGGVINDGILEATTSVSRNGFIQLSAADIQLGVGSTIAIGPDPSNETIPQDPVSLSNFKPSLIEIGGNQSLVEIQQNAMLYAPGGNVAIGVASGPDTVSDSTTGVGQSRVFIDTGAVIDVAGLPDVIVPASLNGIAIHPVTGNDLQNDPSGYKNGFLNGATVYIDPRLSGVRSDGVAWVGSPLVPAESYAQQVGVTVDQLMTKGGNVSLGVASYDPNGKNANANLAGDVTIKSGAVVDLDGGWVTYQAGWVKTTELIDAAGSIVNIADANPNDTFIGIYGGFVDYQPRWGVAQTYSDPLLQGPHYVGQYTEGRDAGSLTIKGSVDVLDGTVYANAFPGAAQLADAQAGTAKSSVYGDQRAMQAAPSQLPLGGFLFVQALGTDSNGAVGGFDGGGDINVVTQANYQPVSSSLAFGQSISIDSNGNLVIPTRDPASYLPPDRIDTISLSADALSSMGLSDLSLATSGQITLEQGANIDLAPGGTFNAVAGRTITINGNVSVPSGTINLQTIFLSNQFGSLFVPEPAQPGSFDVVVNGTLSARGLWTNDYSAGPGSFQGSAYINGGTINIDAAAGVLLYSNYQTVQQAENCSNGGEQCVNVDLSGSILINSGSRLDVSSGGYVSPTGALNLSGKGGNLSLIQDVAYFQLGVNGTNEGGLPGFRVTTNCDSNGFCYVPVNPGAINARVAIAPGTILAAGFAGGGTFTLDTPAISFGDGTASTGTELPLDFFSQAGFANYNITSYKTDLVANTFNNNLGGYNAILATQVLTVGAGQTLDLSQSYLALAKNDPALAAAQIGALRGLASGGDVYSVIQPTIPGDAWDRKAVNLTLGGLIELQVAHGGTILDEAGGVLTVSQLDNEGTIRIAGGTINQIETLPDIFVRPQDYTQSGLAVTPYSPAGLGVQSLSQVFSTNPDGSINETATTSLIDPNTNLPWNTPACASANGCTNAQMATFYDFYLLGTLGLGVGVHLGAGSVTDLSGASIRNPFATAPGQTNFVTGRLVAGGTLESQPHMLGTTSLFQPTFGNGIYSSSIGIQRRVEIL